MYIRQPYNRLTLNHRFDPHHKATVGSNAINCTDDSLLSNTFFNYCLEANANLRKAEEKKEKEIVIPPALRGVSQDHSVTKYVFEKPPHTKTLSYCTLAAESAWDLYDDEVDKNIHTSSIKLPWTVYSIKVGRNGQIVDIETYFSLEENTTGNTPLVPALIPNIYADGLVCLGEKYVETESVGSVFLEAYELIWGFGFNADLYENCNTARLAGWPNKNLWMEAREEWGSQSHLINRWQSVMSNATFEQILDPQNWNRLYEDCNTTTFNKLLKIYSDGYGGNLGSSVAAGLFSTKAEWE